MIGSIPGWGGRISPIFNGLNAIECVADREGHTRWGLDQLVLLIESVRGGK